MEFRCKAERPGGTLVEFGSKASGDYRSYLFEPNEEGDHTAHVDDAGDCSFFLAVSDGYELAGDDKLKADAEATKARDAEWDRQTEEAIKGNAALESQQEQSRKDDEAVRAASAESQKDTTTAAE